MTIKIVYYEPSMPELWKNDDPVWLENRKNQWSQVLQVMTQRSNVGPLGRRGLKALADYYLTGKPFPLSIDNWGTRNKAQFHCVQQIKTKRTISSAFNNIALSRIYFLQHT